MALRGTTRQYKRFCKRLRAVARSTTLYRGTARTMRSYKTRILLSMVEEIKAFPLFQAKMP